MILGISGTIASGKTFVSQNILKARPLFYTSFSDVLKRSCEISGQKPTRDVLQNLGQQMITAKGADGFVDWIIRHIDLPNDNILLDGFRHVAIWRAFQRRYPTARLVFCDVSGPEQIRRICARDNLTPTQAEQIIRHPVEQDVCRLKALSSAVFDEKTTEEDIVRFMTQPTHIICTQKRIPKTHRTHCYD